MSDVEARGRRNRSVRDAVVASLASKGCSMVLQFVSLPIAARVLGREEFGIFATIFVGLFAVELLQLGVGPALAKGIAEAASDDDRERERRLYLAGALLVVGLALLGAGGAALAAALVPVTALFGGDYAGWEHALVPALWTGIALLAADVISRHTDRVREGYMEAGIAIAWVAAGNLLGAVAVVVLIQIFPSPSTLLVAVFLPSILMRVANTVQLLRKRPWLVRGGGRPGRAELSEMLRDGVFFTAISTLTYLVELSLSGLLVGRVLGPSGVALHFVLVTFITAFTGMLVMVGNPLWAAIVDARKRGDHEWLGRATRRYYQYLMLLSLAAAAGLVGLGPRLIPLLFGPEFEVGRLVLSGHAALLFALGWRRVNRYVAIGLGLLPQTVAPILYGLAISAVLGFCGLHAFGLWALYAGLAAGALAVPGVALPRLVRARLASLETPTPAPPPTRASA